MSFRNMVPFIFLNIIVSAAVVLGILYWWDGRQETVLDTVVPAEDTPLEPINQDNSPVVESVHDELPADSESDFAISQESDLETHIVSAGETLGVISNRYDISMEEIMAANGMDNPNFLSIGQELIIPTAGVQAEEIEEVAEEIEETDEVPVELPTPIPTIPAGEGETVIEVADVTSPGQLSLEAVQIVNNGSSETKLSGWKLADQFGNYYTFGAITLFGDGAGIMLHTGAGQDTLTDLYWGEEESLWKSGDKVILYDAEGAVQAEFEIP